MFIVYLALSAGTGIFGYKAIKAKGQAKAYNAYAAICAAAIVVVAIVQALES